MDKKNSDLNKKFKIVIIIGLIALCIMAYLYIIGPYLAIRNEGAPYFVFVEAPVNATLNSSIIHLEDKDFVNMGLNVKKENGKITSVYFRPSGIHPLDFNNMYGSDLGDPASRKYLEYKGVYYYGELAIP